jgi:hypothetical protein
LTFVATFAEINLAVATRGNPTVGLAAITIGVIAVVALFAKQGVDKMIAAGFGRIATCGTAVAAKGIAIVASLGCINDAVTTHHRQTHA